MQTKPTRKWLVEPFWSGWASDSEGVIRGQWIGVRSNGQAVYANVIGAGILSQAIKRGRKQLDKLSSTK